MLLQLNLTFTNKTCSASVSTAETKQSLFSMGVFQNGGSSGGKMEENEHKKKKERNVISNFLII